MFEIISIYIAVAFSAAIAGFCLGTCFVPNEKLDIIKANKQTANDMASKAAAEKAIAELKLNADKIKYDAMNEPISVWIKFNVLLYFYKHL